MFKRIALIAATAALAVSVSISFAATAKICIDPGHGGSDNGASSTNGGLEDRNNLNTALKFKSWLSRDTSDGAGGGSWSVVMTRTTDVAVSLAGRCSISNNNGCNRFMCIHNNAFNASAHGTETFCYGSGSSNSFNLRNRVQSRMINAWGLTNRGNKTANFYVLVNTNAPAELAELGFIDAYPDYNYVDSSTRQDSAAKAHMYAIQNHYGLSAYTPK